MLDHRLEAREMIGVDVPFATNRHAHAMDAQRITFADVAQLRVRHAARPHVIFGVYLEEADIGTGIENFGHMLRLEAHPGTRREGFFAKTGGRQVSFKDRLHAGAALLRCLRRQVAVERLVGPLQDLAIDVDRDFIAGIALDIFPCVSLAIHF